MKKVKLSEIVGQVYKIYYPSQSFVGKITCDKIHGRPYFHLVFKSQIAKDEKEDKFEDCIQTVFLREEDLTYHTDFKNQLYSNENFFPIWTHHKRESDPEYFELEKILNMN
jgi:hypothetical protein